MMNSWGGHSPIHVSREGKGKLWWIHLIIYIFQRILLRVQTQIWTFIFSAIGLLLSLDFVVKTVILKLLEPVFSLRLENSPTVSATSRSCEPSTHPKLLSSRTRSPNTSRYTMWPRALRTLKKSSCKLTFIVTNMSLTGAKSMHKSNKLCRKWSQP